MNLLLDTCALLALAGHSGKLPKKATAALAKAATVLVSTVTTWEIAIKAKAGKILLEQPADDWFRGARSFAIISGKFRFHPRSFAPPRICRCFTAIPLTASWSPPPGTTASPFSLRTARFPLIRG